MSVLVNHSEKQLYSRWKWLYASLFAADENGQKKPAVEKFTREDIEHYGPSNNLNKINWLSFSDLEDNVDLMDAGQAGMIRALCDEKFHYKNEEKKQTNSTLYMGNTIVSIMANFEYAKVMCQCGTVGAGVTAKKKPCSKWKYCDRCANTQRRYAFQKYAGAYKADVPSYFITFTKTEKVKFVDGNHEAILHDWDQLNTYADAMYKNKMITGGLRCEEMSIDNLYPVAVVNPHLHILCQGIDGLENQEFDGMKIQVKKIKDEDHWVECLHYVHKCMDLFSTYVREWNVQNGAVINRNLRDCMDNHKFQIKNRNQIRAFGTFHGKSTACVAECIKNVKPYKNNAGQKGAKKINYKSKGTMNIKAGISALTTKPIVPTAEVIKVAFGELQTPPAPTAQVAPKKEEPTPWYKNPWILGGGALAGAGALYGGGKLYNGGDNFVNNTFGKGVDDYIVNPIKGLFNGPSAAPTPAPVHPKLPTPVLPTPNDRYWKENMEIANDPRYAKLQAGFQNREAELNAYLARLKANTEPRSGTFFEGADPEATQKEIDRIQPYSQFGAIDPQTFKSFINDKKINPDVDQAFKDLDVAGPDKFFNWLNSHQAQQTGGAQLANGAARVLHPVVLADMGVNLAGLGVSAVPALAKIPGLQTATNISGKLAVPLVVAGGAVDGYRVAQGLGQNTAQHTLTGAAMPILGAAGGRILGGMAAAGLAGGAEGSLLPGVGTVAGALTASAAYPATQAFIGDSNRSFEDGARTMQDTTTVIRQFQDAYDQLNKHHNPLPLAGLRESNLFKKYTDNPNMYRPYAGQMIGPTQMDDNSLAQLMYLKNHNISDLYSKSFKDIVAGGKALLPPANQDTAPSQMLY